MIDCGGRAFWTQLWQNTTRLRHHALRSIFTWCRKSLEISWCTGDFCRVGVCKKIKLEDVGENGYDLVA
jgi:hypothetical protein